MFYSTTICYHYFATWVQRYEVLLKSVCKLRKIYQDSKRKVNFYLLSKEKPPLWRLFLFVHVDGCASWKSLAVGFVELREVHFAHTDVERDCYEGAEQFAVFARVERRRWQNVVAVQCQFLCGSAEANFPDEVVCRPEPEPRTEDIADAEPFALACEELPRALQPDPELYEAFLSVFDGNHTSLLNLRLYSAVLQKRPLASS